MALVVLFLCALLGTQTTTLANGACENDDIRLLPTGDFEREGVVQLCHDGNWRTLCRDSDKWNRRAGNLACGQLGYSNEGSRVGYKCLEQDTSNKYMKELDCPNEASDLTNCKLEEKMGCNGCSGNNKRHARVQCRALQCTDEEFRLVGGSSNREGRVEHCMDGRWGTVCGEGWGEDEASELCGRLGFSREGVVVIQRNSPKTVPVYNCSDIQQTTTSCDLNANVCNYSMNFEIRCQERPEVPYQEYDTTSLQDSTTSTTATMSTEDTVSADEQQQRTCTTLNPTITSDSGTCVSPGAMGGVVGVLLVLLIILAVGWTLTCVAIWNRNLIKRKPTKTDPTEPSTCTTNRQFANPVYDSTTDNNYSSSGPTYELVDANEGPTATYSVIERDHMTPEPTSEDEDHTYHVLEAGPVEEGACDYEVPVSRHSQVPLCEQEYSTLQH